MTDDTVVSVAHGIERTFGQDFDEWRSYFELPCPFVGPGGRLTLDESMTEADFFWPQLRDRGFARTRLDRAAVHQLTDSTALLDTSFTRLKTDGTELETLGAFYVCRHDGERWRACLVTGHPYDEPVVE